MATIRRVLSDDRSAIRLRQAAIASAFAMAAVGAGIFLMVVGNQLHERSSHRVLWALVEGVRTLI
ncbi:MAG TPA: hypothetical protein VHQ91_11980 [Geminicoccaceae bacterium]|jgi:hypothetical protein|nr:hypothetical protein [Geminicoccaceae bacterium]